MENMQDRELSMIKELIRIVFQNFNSRKGINKISKKTIQKILYRINTDLPMDNEIKNIIPFYWYIAGPYCENVDKTINIMKTEQILIEDDGIYEMYRFNSDYQHRRFTNHQDFQLEEIRNKIGIEVDNFKGFSNLQLVNEIYEDSPILFYPNYKTRFLVYFESFCKYYVEHIDGKNIFTEKDILDSLENATISLPSESFFNDFRITFMQFKKMIEVVINYKKKNDSEYIIVLESLKNLANDVWKTFAYGARILNHDLPYESRLPQWNQMFKDQTSILTNSTKQMSIILFNTLKISIEEQKTDKKSPEDKEFRLQLAKSIGLDTLPDYDPESFDRLSGIIASKIKTKKFDSVELVREIRNG